MGSYEFWYLNEMNCIQIFKSIIQMRCFVAWFPFCHSFHFVCTFKRFHFHFNLDFHLKLFYFWHLNFTFEWTMAKVSTHTLQPPYSCLIAWCKSILNFQWIKSAKEKAKNGFSEMFIKGYETNGDIKRCLFSFH